MTWTKLHHLCGAEASPSNTDAILKLSLSHPEDMNEVDDQGNTPLHVEAIRGDHPREEVIKALLHTNPNIVMKKNLHGSTPLHLALFPETDANVIRFMLDACPIVALEKDKEGLMPLHAACRYCPGNAEIIRMLLEANPNALSSRMRMGNVAQKKSGVSPSLLPIGLARHNQHLVLDGAVSSAWRASLILEERSHQVRDGSYPLHMAIANGAPQQVLEMLITGAPGILSKADKFGRTCLHLAVKNGDTVANEASEATPDEEKLTISTMDIVKLLHSADTNQVKAKDITRQLPLHMACEVGCSIDVVKYLISAYPDAIHMKNKDGKRPYEVAAAFGHCKKELIDYLLELSDTVDVEVAQ